MVDDDGETVPVLGVSRTSALSAPTLACQVEEHPDDKGLTGGVQDTILNTVSSTPSLVPELATLNGVQVWRSTGTVAGKGN